MIAAASLIGFGLVVLAVSMLSSLALGGMLALGESRLRLAGPCVERHATTLALLLPPLFGLGASVIIATMKLLAFAAGKDHCLGHSHHLHLCPIHGAPWIGEPWAVAAVAFFSTYILVQLAQTIWSLISAQRAALRLCCSGQPLPGFAQTFLVPSDEQFVFTTGVFSPAVIISRAAWDALDSHQRQAVLAHEHAHLIGGDLWKRAVLGLLSCFGVPVLAHRALKLWELATERVCDLDAVAQVGRPSIVASAILSLARAQSGRRTPAVAVFAASGDINVRVHSLFDQSPSGRSAAKRLVVALLAVSAAMAICWTLFAESLHHLLETILG